MITQGKGLAAAALAVLAAVFGMVSAQAQVTLRLPATVDANVGDLIEVGVDLDHGDTAPATVVFFVAYEKVRLAPAEACFEVIRRDADGEPVRDENGEVVVTVSSALPAAAVLAAGKAVEVEHLPELSDAPELAATGVVVTGLNDTPLPKGRLLTLGFRVLEANFLNDTIALRALDAGDPLPHAGRLLQSSASAADGAALPTDAVGGTVALGCARGAAPEGLTATTDREDEVKLAWTGAAGMEYRVLRADPTAPNTLTALGEGWTEATLFLDITAPAPEVVRGPILFCNGRFVPAARLYQVKARPVGGGCESELAPAVEGYRAPRRSAAEAAKQLLGLFGVPVAAE
ncbi:MAG TPA: hypothetical protein PKL54_03450 [Candidatus Hydrogenedentes bacterium]|nr:hypothetical protein [Candidatus Hydrogenedentota bacterium]